MYTAAYPIHDDDCGEMQRGHVEEHDYNKVPVCKWPLRRYLRTTWARLARWHTYQPLDQIREYYGEKVID